MDLAHNIAAYVTNDDNATSIADDLTSYYRGDPPALIASRFDDLSRQAEVTSFNEIDFEAVAALGHRLNDETIDQLQTVRAERLAELLAELDAQVKFMTIWDAPDSVWDYPDSPLPRTFLFLRDEIPGVRGIMASKLLACKYPELVPIRDVATERIVGTDHTGPWGLMMKAALTPDVRDRLYDYSSDTVPGYVSLLRRLGASLWMAATRNPGKELRPDGTIG